MKIKRLLFILPVAIMILIFMFSSQNGKTSLNLSDGLIYNFVSGFCELFSIDFIDVSSLTASLRTVVRKLAHFSIYAFLGGSLLISFYYNFLSLRIKRNIFISQFLSIIYAISDEVHQMLIPGRNGNLFDVIIDSAGAFVGILLVFWIICRKNKLE
ncbi:MAG: VanZ family protein [Clostridia bacterium]|nr:VanZ family protein [Clostridia bacterium]